jgi:hypothetical protein
VPDVPYRFREPLLRYTEFVGPVLDFVRLQQTDAASVLRTFVREIVGHRVLSDLRFNAVIWEQFRADKGAIIGRTFMF